MFLGIDLGLSALKVSIVDTTGACRAQSRVSIQTHQPFPLWAEQNPDTWWDALDTALLLLKSEHPQLLAAVEVLSITGGAHIAVLCDDNLKPRRPAILWSDQRAGAYVETIAPLALSEAGNQASPTWTLLHLLWLRAHEPSVFAQIKRIYFAKDWLRARLTGDFLTDPGDACGSMLMNFQTETWSDALLQAADINPTSLPSIASAHTQTGTIAPHLTQAWGLNSAVRVLVGTIDTTAEWLCWGPPQAGKTTLKLASAGVIAVSQNNGPPCPPISRYPQLGDQKVYYAAGMNQCMNALDWVAAQFFSSLPDMLLAAQTAPIGANGVCFYPYLNGERAPLWRPELTASFAHMTRASNKADIARAAVEGIGFAFRDIYLSMEDQGLLVKNIEKPVLHLLGGGAASDLICQCLADILGAEMHRRSESGASYGAALLAGGIDAPPPGASHIFTPNPTAQDAYSQAYKHFIGQRAAVYPTLQG